MYAFVMRPESLPKSYQDFIQKTGPVAEPVYKAVRECCRGGPMDLVSLSAYLSNKKGFSSMNLMEYPSIIPCSVIHPDRESCLVHNGTAASETFRKTFPLYFSLTFVPFVVLRLQKFLESPAWTSWRAVLGAVRSTSFLSAFVGLFQAVVCLHRKVASKDHKLVYWIAGAIAALSVLIEKKGRRAELALYVLPRAVDSLWYISVNRHFLPHIKNAEHNVTGMAGCAFLSVHGGYHVLPGKRTRHYGSISEGTHPEVSCKQNKQSQSVLQFKHILLLSTDSGTH
ncbi:hypothetical protein B296_00006534 [Ensete ventricosum]|uniref:Transmembrane protein 135 N-terminal domain-containing protein n=1 Tax=Ensete ventricosum TaxID=4639 RepID=A0A426ZTD6_ENSVE|nr:hypothetical protein B296_00006534 [Ensete ventricosum]